MNRRTIKSNGKLKEMLQDVFTMLCQGKRLDDIKLSEVCAKYRVSRMAKECINDLCIQSYITDDYVKKVALRIDARRKGMTEQHTSLWERWSEKERLSFCLGYLKERGFSGKLERHEVVTRDTIEL